MRMSEGAIYRQSTACAKEYDTFPTAKPRPVSGMIPAAGRGFNQVNLSHEVQAPRVRTFTSVSAAGSAVHRGGGLFGERRSALEAVGAAVHDLYGTEPLTTANAVPTAEGAVALALEHSPVTLHGSRCLVIGFGRVGKVLAEKLRALNAEVTVAVRKDGDEALAEAMGLHTDRTGSYRHGLGQYDFLFNTVPAPTLSNAQLDLLAPDALLIELASKPGGFSPEHRANCLNAPGLPGKFAPKTAGTLYANSILRILESEESL